MPPISTTTPSKTAATSCATADYAADAVRSLAFSNAPIRSRLTTKTQLKNSAKFLRRRLPRAAAAAAAAGGGAGAKAAAAVPVTAAAAAGATAGAGAGAAAGARKLASGYDWFVRRFRPDTACEDGRRL